MPCIDALFIISNPLKKILIPLKITGHLVFAVLFIFSFLFFKERHAFDASHYLFEIITRKNFFIAHGRLIGFVSQILPLTGVYINASLKSLMLLYSFGDVLYYYVLFLIASHFLKSTQAGISILLIVCLAVKFSFYCPVTELLQGMALLPFLYEALLRINRFQYHLIPILLVLIIFSHPLLFILVGFAIAFFIIPQRTDWFTKQNLLLVSTFAIITAAKFLLLDKYDYQKSFYPVVFDDYSHFENVKDANYIFSFLLVYMKENFLVGLLWAISLYLLLTKKKFLECALVFFAPVLFLLLIIVTHGITAITNYSERMLLPFAGMVILSFALSVEAIKSNSAKRVLMVLIAFVICFRLWIIYDAVSPYAKRVAQIQELIHQAQIQNVSKCIIDERNLEYLPYAMTGWSYPIESLLLSSLHSKDSSVTIALKEEHFNRYVKRILNADEIYKTQDSIINYSMLNPDYFLLPQTPYVFLNSSCNNGSAIKPAITIDFLDKVNGKSTDDYCYLNTNIINRGTVLCSDIDNGYQMQLDAMSEIDSAYRDSRIIPFQTNILHELRQDLLFKNYGINGSWKVSVYLIDKNKQTVKRMSDIKVMVK